MNDSRDEIEQTLDAILTRNLVDELAQPGWNVLEQCSISLLRFPNRNALLITCYSEASMPAELYAKVPDIAKVIHREHGRTHICLRHYQKHLITRWDSEYLL